MTIIVNSSDNYGRITLYVYNKVNLNCVDIQLLMIKKTSYHPKDGLNGQKQIGIA